MLGKESKTVIRKPLKTEETKPLNLIKVSELVSYKLRTAITGLPTSIVLAPFYFSITSVFFLVNTQ